MKTLQVLAFVVLSMSLSFAAPKAKHAKSAHKDLAYHAAKAGAKHGAKAAHKSVKVAYAVGRFVL